MIPIRWGCPSLFTRVDFNDDRRILNARNTKNVLSRHMTQSERWRRRRFSLGAKGPVWTKLMELVLFFCSLKRTLGNYRSKGRIERSLGGGGVAKRPGFKRSV